MSDENTRRDFLTTTGAAAGLAAFAAALTGGLSLLAQATWKRTFGSRDACGKALEDLRGDDGAAAVTPP